MLFEPYNNPVLKKNFCFISGCNTGEIPCFNNDRGVFRRLCIPYAIIETDYDCISDENVRETVV